MEGIDPKAPEASPQIGNASQRAFKLIIEASQDCPASVNSQAAIVALRTKESGDDPLVLRDALLADDAKLSAIANAGKAMHTKSGKGPINHIPLELVIGIVTANFTKAHRMGHFLTPDQLRYISDDLYHKFDDQKGIFRDDFIDLEVEAMIREADRGRNTKAEKAT